MTEHTIFIPTPRDRKNKLAWINMNQRLHWAPKAERTRQWRIIARHVAENKGLPKQLDHVRIIAHVHRTDNRSYDCHNYLPTAKAIVDGLVDYGLLPDDNNDHLEGPDMRRGQKHAQPGITITIKETT